MSKSRTIFSIITLIWVTTLFTATLQADPQKDKAKSGKSNNEEKTVKSDLTVDSNFSATVTAGISIGDARRLASNYKLTGGKPLPPGILFQPNWFINDFDGLEVAATHGSPWRYDTFVPVIFAGAGLEPQKIYREIHTVDVAPTLSAAAGTKPPSGTRGKVLVEVLDKQ